MNDVPETKPGGVSKKVALVLSFALFTVGFFFLIVAMRTEQARIFAILLGFFSIYWAIRFMYVYRA